MANPENNANDQASAPTSVHKTGARAQFEAERMNRRAALRKFGIGAGMAALLALSSDDLARMAATKLKQQAGDNKIANQIADEFKNAGVAFADPSGGGGGTPPNPCTDSPGNCEGCLSQKYDDCLKSTPWYQWIKCYTALRGCQLFCVNGTASEAGDCFANAIK